MKKHNDNDVDNDEPGTAAGWWMAPGPALCTWCEQPHHVEAMLYCSACDAPVCAVCVMVAVGSEPRCPLCHETAGDV